MKIIKIVSACAIVIGLSACSASVPVGGDNSGAISSSVLVSPLEEFIGQAVWNDQVEFQRAADEFVMRREELIAGCMQQAGFTYQPDLASTRFSIGTDAFDDVHPTDPQWVAQYGFGVVSGHRHRSGGSVFDVRHDDPNAEYVAGLSDTARMAFEMALNGPAGNFPTHFNTHSDWEDWMQTRGCWGRAIVQAQSENPLFIRQADEFAPLLSAISEMHESVLARPEMVSIDSEWSHCMADAGHQGSHNPNDAANDIMIEWWSATFLVQQQQAEGETVDVAATMAELQTRELERALADLDCRTALNYDERVNAIMFEAETQFVANHRALLEDFRNAATP